MPHIVKYQKYNRTDAMHEKCKNFDNQIKRMPETQSISVIIPTYNRRAELLRAIESARTQTCPPIEIIVVDDHSDFSVKDFLAEYYGNTVTVIRNSQNLCTSESRNVGIHSSNGEYIALLDSDDYWEPTKLEKQIEIFEKRPEVGLVYCDMWMEEENGNRCRSGKNLIEENIFDRCLEGWTPPNPTTLMIRRSSYDAVGGLDGTFTSNSDVDFFMRIALSNFKVACVPESLSVFTMGGGGRNSNNPAIRFKSTEIFLKKWEEKITEVRGARFFGYFKNNYWKKVAFPIFIFAIRSKRFRMALGIYFRYLSCNPLFYKGIVIATIRKTLRMIQIKIDPGHIDKIR